jgi:hypothetical protein
MMRNSFAKKEMEVVVVDVLSPVLSAFGLLTLLLACFFAIGRSVCAGTGCFCLPF